MSIPTSMYNSETKWNANFSHDSGKNTSTKENFEVVQLEQKIKKIREKKKKLSNVKGIQTFEDLYDSANSGSSSGKEGFGTKVQQSSGETLDGYLHNYKDSTAKNSGNMNTALSDTNIGKAVSIDSLKSDIDGLLTTIGDLTNGQIAYYGDGINYSTPDDGANVFSQSIASHSEEVIQRIAKSLKNAIKSIINIIKLVFYQLSAQMRVLFKSIQLFLLNFNYYVQQCSLKMASALTGQPEEYYKTNAGGVMELTIFRKQITSFLNIILIWVFLYNWYYVMFFLQPEERFHLDIDANIFFNQNAGEVKAATEQAEKSGLPRFAIPFIKKEYTLLYNLVGPALRVPEFFNWLIVECIGTSIQNWKYPEGSDRKNAGKQIIPNYLLFIAMAFIVIILVSANVPNSIMVDFFNSFSTFSFSLNNPINPSILSIFSTAIVFWYGTNVMINFCSNTFGMLIRGPNIFFGMGAILLCLIFCILYGMYLLYICLPIGMISTTAYFFIYTFLAIVLYNGINLGTTIRAISNSVFKMSDLFDSEDIDTCKNSGAINSQWTFYSLLKNLASWSWWKNLPFVIGKWIRKITLYMFAFLFEIIMILMLLGGIDKYRKNYQTVLFKKATTDSVGSLGKVIVNDASQKVQSSLKQLFTWLIGINVILIVLFFIAMRWKYRDILHIIDVLKGKEEKFNVNNPLNTGSESVNHNKFREGGRQQESKPVVQDQAAKPVAQDQASKPVVQDQAAKPVVQDQAAKPVAQSQSPNQVSQSQDNIQDSQSQDNIQDPQSQSQDNRQDPQSQPPNQVSQSQDNIQDPQSQLPNQVSQPVAKSQDAKPVAQSQSNDAKSLVNEYTGPAGGGGGGRQGFNDFNKLHSNKK